MIHTTPRRPRRAGQRSIALSARNMGAHTLGTTPRSAGATIETVPTRRQAGHPDQTSLQVKQWDEVFPANPYQNQEGSTLCT